MGLSHHQEFAVLNAKVKYPCSWLECKGEVWRGVAAMSTGKVLTEKAYSRFYSLELLSLCLCFMPSWGDHDPWGPGLCRWSWHTFRNGKNCGILLSDFLVPIVSSEDLQSTGVAYTSLLQAAAFTGCKGTVHAQSATFIPATASSVSIHPPLPFHLRFLLVFAKQPCERNKIILKSII